jgi:NTE family protein
MAKNVVHSTNFLSRQGRLALFLLGALLSLTSTVGHSQVAKGRPRIGLALNGEGAIGFAQVGVLAWLEEHHVPVDYIAGTSVGGWVGGGYATGMSANEIHQFLRSIDFSVTLFLGDAPYQEKGNWTKSEKLELPGLPGLQLDAFVASKSPDLYVPLLPGIAHSYGNLRSFDDLPTPFRCLAVDLVTGRLLVLNSGSLPDALRATITMIGVNSPVHHGPEVLVSGAFVDSIPTDVVRNMGADIVIASFTDFLGRTGGETEFKSTFQQIVRTLDVARTLNEGKGLQTADVVIRPDARSFSVADLSRVDQLVEQGYRAAQEKTAMLMRFAVSDSDWQQYVTTRQQRRIR